MLRQRVLTALVLIPLVVFGILYLENRLFAFLLALAFLVGASEMARLANLDGLPSIAGFVLAVAGLLWLSWLYLKAPHLVLVQWGMAIWWLFVTLALLARSRELKRVDERRPSVLLLGCLVLVTAWVSIVRLHAAPADGPAWVLCLFLLIWVADSGAFFAGRAYGKTKLSPFVSPGKTWAGAAGAALGATIFAGILWFSGIAVSASFAALVLLCLLVTMVSIGGDLWESRLKREAGVKDSGKLLPGHGGMLDRIDSLLAAAPVFALGLGLIGVRF